MRGDPQQQLVALRRQLRRGGVGIEFGQRAVEIKQKNKRGVGRAASNLGLYFRQHLARSHDSIVAGKSLRSRVSRWDQG